MFVPQTPAEISFSYDFVQGLVVVCSRSKTSELATNPAKPVDVSSVRSFYPQCNFSFIYIQPVFHTLVYDLSLRRLYIFFVCLEKHFYLYKDINFHKHKLPFSSNQLTSSNILLNQTNQKGEGETKPVQQQ